MIRERLVELHAERTGAGALTGERSLAEARRLCAQVLAAYWRAIQRGSAKQWKLRACPGGAGEHAAGLDGTVREACDALGRALATLPPTESGYELGTTYAGLIPVEMRAKYGVYYTPPAVAERLLDLVEEEGVDWCRVSVLDPACGGGAFVAAVAERVRRAMRGRNPSDVVRTVGQRVRGYEIDPFSAWMSQAFAEAVMLPECQRSETRLERLVSVRNSLSPDQPTEEFDLVIGNPPYGKTKLSERDRVRFGRGVFGHANLYGLFTDQAVRWTKQKGMIAYVTPTGMLSGEYFKKLRGLLMQSAPPARIELLDSRKGVFDGVLQETMLAVYVRGAATRKVKVSSLGQPDGRGRLPVSKTGVCVLPFDPTAPWLLPRDARDAALIEAANQKPMRLHDYGFRIKTGPLVWNRHKQQLRHHARSGTHPLVWAECVLRDGAFEFRATKRNHAPYFALEAGQDWLLSTQACVLVQRTTAKEQSRRLIAAVLPESFVKQSCGVVVENHLNMIVPADVKPVISLRAVAAVLNSAVADRLFRCLSGSVAVSAYELAALPMPNPPEMKRIEAVLRRRGGQEQVDELLKDFYGEA